MSDPTVDVRVKQFIDVRDKIKEIEERQKKELEPFKTLKNQLAGWLQEYMTNSGSEGIRTAYGTCSLSSKTSASLEDADAFMQFVIENKQYELLDRRANSTAVQEYVKETGSMPPGVNLSTIQTVGVRRKSGT